MSIGALQAAAVPLDPCPRPRARTGVGGGTEVFEQIGVEHGRVLEGAQLDRLFQGVVVAMWHGTAPGEMPDTPVRIAAAGRGPALAGVPAEQRGGYVTDVPVRIARRPPQERRAVIACGPPGDEALHGGDAYLPIG